MSLPCLQQTSHVPQCISSSSAHQLEHELVWSAVIVALFPTFTLDTCAPFPQLQCTLPRGCPPMVDLIEFPAHELLGCPSILGAQKINVTDHDPKP